MNELLEQFNIFQTNHPLYKYAFNFLEKNSETLAIAAKTVYQMQGKKLGLVADDILSYLEKRDLNYCLETYIKRVNDLMELQNRFEQNPSLENLCSPGVSVSRDAYDISLLLSIVFCNHRFEIIQQLTNFLNLIYALVRKGCLYWGRDGI